MFWVQSCFFKLLSGSGPWSVLIAFVFCAFATTLIKEAFDFFFVFVDLTCLCSNDDISLQAFFFNARELYLGLLKARLIINLLFETFEDDCILSFEDNSLLGIFHFASLCLATLSLIARLLFL